MRINPAIHEYRKAAIQDIARKAAASKNVIFEQLKRHEGAEGALQDAIKAIDACKADVRKQAETDGDVTGAKAKMACYDDSIRAVTNLRDTAHVGAMILTGKLAQAEEHLQHCEALFNDEQSALDAYAAAINAPQPDDGQQASEDEGGVTPKAPPKPIPQLHQDAPVGPPVEEKPAEAPEKPAPEPTKAPEPTAPLFFTADPGEPTPEEAAGFPGEHISQGKKAAQEVGEDDAVVAQQSEDDARQRYDRELAAAIPEFSNDRAPPPDDLPDLPDSPAPSRAEKDFAGLFEDEGEDATDDPIGD